MTHTIELGTRTLILTDEELRKIYEVQLNIYHYADLQNTLVEEFECITDAAREYVDSRMADSDALESYEDKLGNGWGWRDACRNTIEQLLDDYETETGQEARE